MSCPNCGNNVPEGTLACTDCGQQMQAQDTASNMQNQYVSQPRDILSAKERGIKKKDYINNEAPDNIKKLSKFSYIVFAVVSVLMIVSIIVSYNMAFYKAPLISMIIDDADILMLEKEAEEKVEIVDDIRNMIESIEDDLSKKTQKKIDKFLDAGESLFEKISVTNFKKVVKAAEELNEESLGSEVEEILDIDGIDAFYEIISTFDTVGIVYFIAATVIILITFLSAHFKRTGLAVLAIILAAPFVLLITGVVWYLLVAASLVVLVVMCHKVNKAYKTA